MKVQDKNEVVAPQPVADARAGKGVATPSATVQDRVTTHVAQVHAAAVMTQTRVAHNRAARLEALETLVKKGHYSPNPQLIADRILEMGELDARLRAMLKK